MCANSTMKWTNSAERAGEPACPQPRPPDRTCHCLRATAGPLSWAAHSRVYTTVASKFISERADCSMSLLSDRLYFESRAHYWSGTGQLREMTNIYLLGNVGGRGGSLFKYHGKSNQTLKSMLAVCGWNEFLKWCFNEVNLWCQGS